MIQPVILSGGSGSRLWPLSREEHPKHLIPLLDQQTLLQKTLLRLQGLSDLLSPLVVCNERQRFMVAQQLQDISVDAQAIVLEPVGRNTAPAVALAAIKAMEQGQDPLLLVLAADHMIQQADLFRETVMDAVAYATADHLVTFGVVPLKPHTGYGYIHRGSRIGAHAYQVAQFVEKPSLPTAQQYLRSGHYYWNSGMFLFKASVYLKALQHHAPEILMACQLTMKHQQQDSDFTRIDAEAFKHCPDISIDYAVMEKASNVAVLPLDAGWSDVGSWESLWEVCLQDAQNNVVQGDVLSEGVSNSYLRAESRLLTVLGLKEVVVIETPDAVLVADMKYSQAVKNVVQMLKKANRIEHIRHLESEKKHG